MSNNTLIWHEKEKKRRVKKAKAFYISERECKYNSDETPIFKMSCQLLLYHYKLLTFYRLLTLLSSKLNIILCVFIYIDLFYKTHFSFTGLCYHTKLKKKHSHLLSHLQIVMQNSSIFLCDNKVTWTEYSKMLG